MTITIVTQLMTSDYYYIHTNIKDCYHSHTTDDYYYSHNNNQRLLL